jgi:very-short-patch-repair endonuclease
VAFVDREISRVVDRQHGVLSRRRLLSIGLSGAQIKRRVGDGRLRRLYRGVYAVGHAELTRYGEWMAAVIAAGPNALLSHRDAAALWGLIGIGSRTRIDVTAVGRARRARSGLAIHMTTRIHPDDRATREGIPVTSVARTLLDLAVVVDARTLQRAYERAEELRLLDVEAVRVVLDRAGRRPGAPALRALVAYDPAAAAQARSEIERAFLDLVREAGLPEPQVNVDVEGYEVDCWWPRANLVVELDGYEFHRDRAAFERDREKIAALRLAGREVLPLTHRKLTERPDWVVGAVAQLLRRSPSPDDFRQ